MFEQTYKLVKFFEEAKRISGRKKLQKIIYLLQYSGKDFEMNYYYHYYGPYSSDLQIEVQYLVERGFLLEKKAGDTYVYEISKEGEDFLRNYEEKFASESVFNLEAIDELNKKNASFLELLSTYVYLLETGYDKEKAIEKVKKLKPDLFYLISDVVDYFETELDSEDRAS